MITPIPRRPILVATATGGLAVAGLAVANKVGLLDHDPHVPAGTLQLYGTSTGVQSLEFPLGDDVLPAVGNQRWQTADLPTTTHSMLAVTWREGGVVPAVEISSRRGGAWLPWQQLLPLHDLPDLDDDEGNGRTGTDLAWVGPADGIRVRISGRRPNDLRLVLLHPARTAMLGRRLPQNRQVPADELKPVLLTRRDWDANPRMRQGSPSYNHTIEQVHVHHTVNSNDYDADDVRGLIRGMYSYHTQSLGWSDIAYNFLVDRFGNTWVGRAGGPGKAVRGAHTLGFNATSTGVAAIGNYDTARPTDDLLAAIAQLAAWKLAPFDRDPEGSVTVTSEGSDRYRTGARPRLPVIDGHRDTNDTACPGAHLYAALPTVRELAAQRLAGTTTIQVVSEPALGGELTVDRTLRVTPGRTEPAATPRYQWLRGRRPIAGATAATYRTTTADVGAELSVVVTYAASGARSVQRTLSTSGPIRVIPVLAVEAISGAGGVVVTLTATATGARSAPTGTVIVSLPKRERSIVMADGQVQVRFRRPVRTPRPVVVRYAGNTEIWSGTAEATVTVSDQATQRR